MKREFTAVLKHDHEWWIGWIKEIPGINSQAKKREELLTNLRSALTEVSQLTSDVRCPRLVRNF